MTSLGGEPAAGKGSGLSPTVSFVVPTLNAGNLLGDCLRSVRNQHYPPELLEIVVIDGGSTDDTVRIAEEWGARVVPNPHRLAEPGVALGQHVARGELLVILAADNELPQEEWLLEAVRCFQDPEVQAAYTHVEISPGEPAFCRYFNLMHADPFNWFVYGPAANPRRFGDVFPLLEVGDGYRVYDLRGQERPLLAMAQGYVVRRLVHRPQDTETDDILPVWALIDQGYKLAYVPAAGIYHHTLTSFRHFLRKFKVSIRRNLAVVGAGAFARRHLLGPRQRRRQYLWLPYAFSVVGPLLHALAGWRRDRDPAWLYHPVACAGLAFVISTELARMAVRSARLFPRGPSAQRPPYDASLDRS